MKLRKIAPQRDLKKIIKGNVSATFIYYESPCLLLHDKATRSRLTFAEDHLRRIFLRNITEDYIEGIRETTLSINLN